MIEQINSMFHSINSRYRTDNGIVIYKEIGRYGIISKQFAHMQECYEYASVLYNKYKRVA